MQASPKGSSVLLIGGRSAIGSAIEKVAIADGYDVVVTTRTGSNETVQMDVRDNESVKAGIKAATERVGRIDAVIYAPAISDSSLVHAADLQVWSDVYEVNVLGALRVMKELLPSFMRQRNGAALFLSSTAATRGVVGAGAYAASKAALNSLALNIAREYGRFNIRAFTVMPGYVNGGMLQDLHEARATELTKSVSLGRFATTTEIADFCVSAIRNPYLNGTFLTIDGGMHG